jgi:hypothetical protein
MRGPIIVEHVTDGDLAAESSLTYRVKSDGRDLRVFYKYSENANGGTHTFSVKPVAHFSNGDTAMSWPTDSAGTTNYLIQPDGGSSSSTATDVNSSMYVLSDGTSSEYELKLAIAGGSGTLKDIYIVSELV